MRNWRDVSLPLDHLESEVAAAPLVLQNAFHQALTLIRPDFLKHAEGHLLHHFPGLSPEELKRLSDQVWFGTPDTKSPVPLADYLVRLARTYLDHHGAFARPILPSDDVRREEGPARARMRWRWLRLALPEDWLLAALGATKASNGRGSSPSLSCATLTPALAQLLAAEGYAETHLHLNAALEFADVWALAMRSLPDQYQRNLDALRDLFAAETGIANFGAFLLAAALARLLLGAFLAPNRANRAHAADFKKYFLRLARSLQPNEWRVLDAAMSALAQPATMPRFVSTHFAAALRLYRTRIPRSAPIERASRHPTIAAECDPLRLYFRGRPDAPPDRLFLTAALTYLRGEGREDRGFARLFWQMLRVQGMLYRLVTLRPLTPGLAWFTRHYAYLRALSGRTPYRRRQDEIRMRLATAWNQGGGREGLRRLEARLAPPASLAEAFHDQKGFETEAQAGRDCGLIYHLQKERARKGKNSKTGPFARGEHADPEAFGNLGWRFGALYRARKREVRTITAYLAHHPEAARILCGFDLCAEETATPNWVFVPLFAELRRAGKEAAAHHGCPPPRLCVHAGEDFAHLASGLRRLDETIRYFHLGEGDRVGHALALGIDPTRWAQRMGILRLSREERFFDLVWEWRCYMERIALPPDAARPAWLAGEIARFAGEIWGEPFTPAEALALVDALHDPAKLEDIGYAAPNPPALRQGSSLPAKTLERLYDYLRRPSLFRRAAEVIMVDAEQDIPALCVLREGMRQRFSALGIAIETNPSGNLLIGLMPDLDHHPLWEAIARPESPEPPLALLIVSDDPASFATRLPEEYQLVYDTFILQRRTPHEALAFLADVARNTRLYAFRQPREPRARG